MYVARVGKRPTQKLNIVKGRGGVLLVSADWVWDCFPFRKGGLHVVWFDTPWAGGAGEVLVRAQGRTACLRSASMQLRLRGSHLLSLQVVGCKPSPLNPEMYEGPLARRQVCVIELVLVGYRAAERGKQHRQSDVCKNTAGPLLPRGSNLLS